METRLVVVGIIEKDGQFLFGRKPPTVGPYPNTWHLPGGGVEPGESLVEAIRREVREEAGIEISDIEPLTFDEDIEPNKRGVETHYLFLIFTASYRSGELKAGSDIVTLQWFGKSELPTDLNRPTVKCFKKVGLL